MTSQPSPRVSSIPAPDSYILPGRPDDAARHDAYRQTQFLLGNDLDLFSQAMNLPRKSATSRSIIIVTDGYVGCEREAFTLITGISALLPALRASRVPPVVAMQASE